jgi:hypothetical protein
MSANPDKPRRGIQSVEDRQPTADGLARHVTPMALRDLAKAAGMSTGKAHPYLVTFLKVGFVVQDAGGRYELGPLALQLGMAKLRRLDPVKEASPLDRRPGRRNRPEHRAGGVGQPGADHRAAGRADRTAAREPARGHGDGPGQHRHRPAVRGLPAGRLIEKMMADDVASAWAAARRRADSSGRPSWKRSWPKRARTACRAAWASPFPGIDAFSAPVFDSSGNLVLSITAMGTGDPTGRGAANSSANKLNSAMKRGKSSSPCKSSTRGAAKTVLKACAAACASPCTTAPALSVSTQPSDCGAKRKACTTPGGMTMTAGLCTACWVSSSRTWALPDSSHRTWCRPWCKWASISQR